MKQQAITDRQRKRERFQVPAESKKQRPPFLLLALIAVVIAGGAFWAMRPKQADAPQEGQGEVTAATIGHVPYPALPVAEGVARLPIATFDDGKARHYTYMDGDQPIELFILKSTDGVVRAAFNACDVCYASRKGYRQEGDVMVCNNCGQRFPSSRINEVKGGCNPAPLTRTVEGDELIIQVTDIVAGASYFQG